MANNIQIFENEQFGKIRIIEKDGSAWFVGRDVAKSLGYSNPRKAIIDHVDEEDKGVTKRDTLGGNQSFTIINESGLYSLILSSKLSTAKQFKHWITAEVLPSIRKHGAYITEITLDEISANKSAAEKLFRELKAEKAKNRDMKEKLDASEPKCEFYDKVLQAEDLLPMTLIAKDYGMSATRLNAMLYAFRVQYKTHSGTWVLYSEYQDMGYTKTKTFVPYNELEHRARLTMYWTHTGREFLYRFLKEYGILPVSERPIDNK